ncbi:UNVERIFIED_CONTAM: hypothetical protein K2H54_055887 [Gekko kuhli]
MQRHPPIMGPGEKKNLGPPAPCIPHKVDHLGQGEERQAGKQLWVAAAEGEPKAALVAHGEEEEEGSPAASLLQAVWAQGRIGIGSIGKKAAGSSAREKKRSSTPAMDWKLPSWGWQGGGKSPAKDLEWGGGERRSSGGA